MRITEYADKNHKEYFAEAFAAHVYHPAELKAQRSRPRSTISSRAGPTTARRSSV